MGAVAGLAKKKFRERQAIRHGERLILCRPGADPIADKETETFSIENFADVIARTEETVRFIAIELKSSDHVIQLAIAQPLLYSLW